MKTTVIQSAVVQPQVLQQLASCILALDEAKRAKSSNTSLEPVNQIHPLPLTWGLVPSSLRLDNSATKVTSQATACATAVASVSSAITTKEAAGMYCWTYALGADEDGSSLGAVDATFGLSFSCASNEPAAQDGLSEAVGLAINSVGWGNGLLQVNTRGLQKAIRFGHTSPFQCGDTISIFLDVSAGGLAVKYNGVWVGLAIGPAGSGAAFEHDLVPLLTQYESVVPAVSIATPGVQVTLLPGPSPDARQAAGSGSGRDAHQDERLSSLAVRHNCKEEPTQRRSDIVIVVIIVIIVIVVIV
jgi:hypothetical protein